MVLYYQTEREIGWEWQSVDSELCSEPLEGEETGKNPSAEVDGAAKSTCWSTKRAPLFTSQGANEHDKWSADDFISIVVERPDPEQVEQHLCDDRGYDYDDVHQVVAQERYVSHIKHHRRRNEPWSKNVPSLVSCIIQLVGG